jgi:hypothetical protein
MRASCPRCMKSELPYRALLSVHPYFGEFSPTRIICPSCGTSLRVTAKSRFLGAIAVVTSLVGCLLLLGRAPVHLPKWQAIFALVGVVAAYYFILWPVIVRLKPWSPFQYWLPKSRLVGYSVYLVVPILLIASLLLLAIKFGL